MKKVSSRVLVVGGVVAVVVGLLFWLGRDKPTVAAAPAPVAAARCGDGVVNQLSEECDGSALPPNAAPGAQCGPDCRIVREEPKAVAVDNDPVCGDNIINQRSEQCDGKSLPPGVAPGTRCSRSCTLIQPVDDECQECVRRSCAEPRAEVDKIRATAGAVLDCVLGKDWPQGGRAPKDTCAKADLLTCYCDKIPGQDCASTPPASLTGACVAEIMAATDCTTSQCVAQRYMSPTNGNGRAMRYAQCEQDNCYDECFH